MKPLLRILSIIGYVIFYMCCGLFFIGIVIGLFTNTKETVFSIIPLILLVGIYWGLDLLHSKLINKKRIDWECSKELKTISEVLVFAFVFFLGFSVLCAFGMYGDPELMLASVVLLFSILTFWTYFSLMFAKKNALLLLRSYIIIILVLQFLFLKSLFTDINSIDYFNFEFSFNNIIPFALIAVFSFIIAFTIKGLIISFTARCIYPLRKQEYRFVDILLIVIIMSTIVFLFNLRIKFATIDNTNNKYPALNQKNEHI